MFKDLFLTVRNSSYKQKIIKTCCTLQAMNPYIYIYTYTYTVYIYHKSLYFHNHNSFKAGNTLSKCLLNCKQNITFGLKFRRDFQQCRAEPMFLVQTWMFTTEKKGLISQVFFIGIIVEISKKAYFPFWSSRVCIPWVTVLSFCNKTCRFLKKSKF